MLFAAFDLSQVFSALASAGSLAVTGYFWLVRMRAEKPNIRTHLVRVEKVDAARTFEMTWDPIIVVRVAVLNLSTLPNVVLRGRGSVRLPDGRWAEAVAKVTGGAEAFNVAPQVAEFREVTFELPSVPKPSGVSAEALEGMSWREALELTLGGPAVLRVELVALNNKTFTDELTLPAFTA